RNVLSGQSEALADRRWSDGTRPLDRGELPARLTGGRMKILGFEITKAAPRPVYENRGGWWPLVRESFAGAWQQNVEVNQQAVLAYHAVFACMTLIASDIAKLRVKLVAQDSDGIWTETSNAAYSPVL